MIRGSLKALRFILLIVICTSLMYLFTGFVLLPNEIFILEGRVQSVSFSVPFAASVEPDAVTVLSVNNSPVSDSVRLNFGDDLELKADNTGKAEISLSLFGIPLKRVSLDVLPDLELVPCGSTVGVRIYTDGVLVLGTSFVKTSEGSSENPSSGLLKSGDLIISADGQDVRNKQHLSQLIKESGDSIELKVKRSESTIDVTVKPVKRLEDGANSIGAWVRDGTQGIGTLTYYNPQSRKFAALGHGITDVDTKKLMSFKSGEIMRAMVQGVKKGRKGAPGELEGKKEAGVVVGDIKLNNPCGIYGYINTAGIEAFAHDTVKFQTQDRVHEGPAKIRSNIDKDEVKEYDIYIESVNRYSLDDTRGMVIRITDPELLTKTGGIVQGMSGSPILQDGRLIGAVTHVFVQEPSKGYGIFIENMLKQEKRI